MNESTPYLSLIIPAYNEERRIGAMLHSAAAYLSEKSFSWEILVVLDGSEDNTLAVVEEFSAANEHVTCLNRRENRGKGFTVRQGMLAANGQIRLFSDADNSTDMTHFDQMIPLFKEGLDVVICSRDGKDAPGAGQTVPQPALKRFLGNSGNLFIQVVAVPGIWDTQCGYKAFTAEAAQKIFSVARIDGWGFDIEALALARHFGFRTGIIPARWIDNEETHVRLWNYATTIIETIRVRWNLLTKSYDRAAAPVK